MNVMLVSVRERTREIGVRMALGATRKSILRQFFLETIFVVVSAVVSAHRLLMASGLVNLAPMPPFFTGMLTSWKIAVAPSSCSAYSILSALYPAKTARFGDPIEALRFEAGG